VRETGTNRKPQEKKELETKIKFKKSLKVRD
jgi:hypothetical protein